MSYIEKCPICSGNGSYIGRQCDGCKGEGEVSVKGGDLNCLICRIPSFLSGISIYFGDYDVFVCHSCHEKHPFLWKVIVEGYCFCFSVFYSAFNLIGGIKDIFLDVKDSSKNNFPF